MGEPSSRNELQFPLGISHYHLGDLIGFEVYKARCTVNSNSTEVAIKFRVFESSDHPAIRFYIDNQALLSQLSHPNILIPHCSFTSADVQLWLVMPYMSAGNLHSVLSSAFPSGIDEPCIAVILKDILNGLSHLHSQGHFFCDGDFLMDSNGNVKLAPNFVASCTTSSSTVNDLAGSPYWVAPELHIRGSKTADIWSVGVVALELAYGCPPTSLVPDTMAKSLLVKINKRFNMKLRGDCEERTLNLSESFTEMVGLCLKGDATKRPSADQLLQDPFFKMHQGAENRLRELPRVEDMFKALGGVSSKNVEDDIADLGNKITCGWIFNEDGFLLDPVYPPESGSDSGTNSGGRGPTIPAASSWRSNKPGESLDESDLGSPESGEHSNVGGGL